MKTNNTLIITGPGDELVYIIQITDSYIHRMDKFENSRVFKIVKNLRQELDLLRSLWLAPINRQAVTICITVVSIQIKAAISIPIASPGMFLPLCCEYTNIFPFFFLLSIVSITFLIYFRSIYLKHTS